MPGCMTEQRVIRKKQWFEGLPGVEGGTGSVLPDSASGGPEGGQTSAFGRSSLPEDKLRETTPASPTAPASVRLISLTGRHLLVHIYETLRDNERELFAEQVLSERTREEFLSRGFAATDAFDLLKAQEEQVVTLLQLMPDAELTPGVRVSPAGNRVQRIVLGPNALASQQLTPGLLGMDMVMERGQWKLRWFVPGPGYEMPRILEPWEREALRQQQIARGQAPSDVRVLVPEDLRGKDKDAADAGLDALLDEDASRPQPTENAKENATPSTPSLGRSPRPSAPPR
jgi:hypothetical protein